ncbi:MAG: TonB-dependent receptor [Candidatus Neomarinimicrobiota bacterium]
MVLTIVLAVNVRAVSISGFVREDATGEPLAYVNVFLKNTFTGTATTQDGYYVIPDARPGEYEIIVSIIGYETITQKVILARDNLRLDFRLKVTSLAGESVTVTAERMKFKEKMELSSTNLSLKEIKSAPGFIEADVFRAIQLLPGVQSLNDFSSALYVRGSTPDQNLIMLDGITVYNPFHLGGVFSTFNTDAIKEADFSAGGFPARYGGRLGSILNIINREGNTEEFSGTANISLISSKLLLEGPLPKISGIKGSWMVAGRRTYFDQILNSVMYFKKRHDKKTGNYYNEEDYVGFPYYFYDLEAKLNVDLGHNHRLTLSSFYGDDVLSVAYQDNWDDTYNTDYYEKYSSDNLFDWRWGNRTNSLTWRWIASPKLIVRTFIAESRFRFRINIKYDENDYIVSGGDSTNYRDIYDLDIFDVVKDNSIQTELTWLPNADHTIMAGIQHKQLDFNLGMITREESIENNISEVSSDTALWMLERPYEEALFIQDKWNLTQLFSMQFGLRLNCYSLHKQLYPEPRLALKYLLQENLSLNFSWGQYHQFLTTANPQDENLRFIDIWLAIPGDRKASFTEHTILGLEYLTDSNILFRLETYYKDFDHLLTLKQGDIFSVEEEILFDRFNEFWDTDAYAYGTEILIKKTTGKIQGWIGYTYARTRRKITGQAWTYPKYDRTHTANAVADWQLTKKWHFSTAVSYASGNPYTPILGVIQSWSEDQGYGQSYWSENDDDNSTEWWENNIYLVGKQNSARYPAYFRWDVSFIHRKATRYGFREFYLQVLNVTNHLNIMTYIYSQKYDDTTEGIKGVRRFGVPMFPIMPTFGVKFEF